MNLTLAVHEMFAAACERMEREARKAPALIDCPICGQRGAVSEAQPGRCWLCEESR